MSGNLTEPITGNEDFKGFVINVKKLQKTAKIARKVVFKADSTVDALFQSY